MRIVVASHNPAKLRAVERAFLAAFADQNLEVVPVAVASGVAEQPATDAETRSGSRNRAEAARQAMPDADFWVGLEGGLERVDGELFASAWMTILRADGAIGTARTTTLPLPPGIRRLVSQGLELGAANDRVFGTANSKQAGGAFGLLTDNRLTRESVYTEALLLALLPLSNTLWTTDTGPEGEPSPSSGI